MIWGRYPSTWSGAAAPKAQSAALPGAKESVAPEAAPRFAAEPEWSMLPRLVGFTYRRLLDILPYVVVVAGCIHVIVEKFKIFFPFWYMVAVPLVMHDFFRSRSFLASILGERCGLRKNDEMTEFWRKSWWEVAYSSHVFAFATMAFWAVYYRFEVFYPMFLPWGLYLSDRLLNWYRAYANVVPIIVAGASKGASTYVVNNGIGNKAEPSHVRLVLKKPHGFTYKA